MSRIRIIPAALLCLSLLSACNGNKKVEPSARWTPEQAGAWSESLPWLSGCNYNPASAINTIEMWSKDTYDPQQIDKELGWAEELGFNTMRTFLSSVVYRNDPKGMKKRMDDFLTICDRHGIKPMFVFFDDCWNPESSYGKQPDPKPGVHNSGWVQDPAVSLRADTTALFRFLEKYVKDIVGTFRGDERILMWDLYNEPGNEKHLDESIPLLKNVFRWAREAGSTQPLTVGVWRNDLKELNRIQLEESDIITYHCYSGSEEEQQNAIDTLKAYGRPLINTEYMARKKGCTFQKMMPLLKENNVGAINWGFVAGKTNTIFAWDDPLPDLAEPELWFHDIFRQDHTPFSEEEIAVIKKCNDAFVFPMAVAHRGCWLKDGDEFYINENCPAGVKMAAQYGYPAIECDVKYTLDSVMVIMHDGTINRTMRNAADYSVIEEPVRVSEHTFEDLRTNYVLASTDPALRVPIPSFKEELEACKEYGIVPMLHSAVVESYELAKEMLGDGFIAFDGNEAAVSRARDYSSCLILLDPGETEASATIERLRKIGGECGMSTMRYGMLDADYIAAMKEAGFEAQASIFPTPHEQRALMDGVTIELSDFFWHQTAGRKPVVSFRKKDVTLQEGETFDWTVEAPEYAAVTLEVDFAGSVEVNLCGRTYTLTREEAGRADRFGLRLYKTTPSLTIKALTPETSVKSVHVCVYDCGNN